MFGNRFYHETTRRYVAMFGTLFNDIVIERKDNQNQVIQKMRVPIHYAPMQKVLARIEGDPNLNAPAMTLPRMSFEITNMNFSPERKLTSLTQNRYQSTDANSKIAQYVPAPYDLEFQLNIMVKYVEDGTKILEQILPFFKPDVTVSVQLIDEMDLKLDVPIILNNVTMDDSYEGDFLTRRSLTYTLGFTVRGYYFGPTENKKVIKFVDAPVKDSLSNNTLSSLSARPGLTSDGQPTTILTGERATATTSVENGSISGIQLLNTGYGYEQATALIAAPEAIRATGGGLVSNTTQISSVEIDNAGGYYTSVPSVQFATPTLGPATPIIYGYANTTTNELGSFEIEDGGRYYIESPNVTVQAPPASIQASISANINETSDEISFDVANTGTNYESANVTVQYSILQDANNFTVSNFFTDESISLIGETTVPRGNVGSFYRDEPYYEEGSSNREGFMIVKIPELSQLVANTDYPLMNGKFYRFGIRKEINDDILRFYHELDDSIFDYQYLDPNADIYTFFPRGETQSVNNLIGQWVRVGYNYRKTSSSDGLYFLSIHRRDSAGTYAFADGGFPLRYGDLDVVFPNVPADDSTNFTITAPPGMEIEQIHFFQNNIPEDLGIEPVIGTNSDAIFPDIYPEPDGSGVTEYYSDFENANTISKTVEITASVSDFIVNSVPSISDTEILRVDSVSIDSPTPARSAFAFAGISGGQVSNLIFQDRGFGYNFIGESASIDFAAGTGTASQFTASGTANVVNGEVVGINVTNSGFGYDASNPPTVLIDLPEAITATANVEIDIDTKEVKNINIINPGKGYRSPASITITLPDEVTIDYNDISEDDDWGYIVQISEGE